MISNIYLDNFAKSNSSLKIMTFIITLWSFLYYYLGDYRVFGLIFYVLFIIVFINKFNSQRLQFREKILLISAMLLIIISLIMHDNRLSTLYSARLFFGFIFFIIWFRFAQAPNIFAIINLFSWSVILEKILIMSFPNFIQYLPNYSLIHFSADNAASIIGGVHGFGGGRTVTGVICLSSFFFVCRNCAGRGFLPLIAALMAGSGTVYFILFAYLIIIYLKDMFSLLVGRLKKNDFPSFALRMSVIIFATYLLLLSNADVGYVFDRFSTPYFMRIFDYKEDIISNWLTSTSGIDILIGRTGTDAHILLKPNSFVGDFAIVDLLYRFGLLGAVVLIFFMILYWNRSIGLALVTLLIGSLHYHVLFSVPGSLFAALLVTYKKKHFDENNS